MYGKFQKHLQDELTAIQDAGLYKNERLIEGPQQAAIQVAGKEVLNFCANNYLGLSNNPRLIQAAKDMMDRRGYGMSSVRFICGTQDIHKQLEAAKLIVVDGFAIDNHSWCQQRGPLAFGAELRVAGVHQHRVAKVVVRAAGAACSADIDAHLLVGLLSERHTDALHALVVANDRSPVWAHLCAEGRSCHQQCAPVAIVVAIRAVEVGSPRKPLDALRLCRYVFDAGGRTVVHVRKEVVSLVPSEFSQVYHQAERHGRMARVASMAA